MVKEKYLNKYDQESVRKATQVSNPERDFTDADEPARKRRKTTDNSE